MPGIEHTAIARMEWDEFERRLQTVAAARTGTPNTSRTSQTSKVSDERAFRQYFGDSEFEELQRRAEQAQAARSRGSVRGNIILIPGTMGSNLISVNRKDEDLIWVNLMRIAMGRIARLRLSPDGIRDADKNIKVAATVVDKRTYSRALLKLGAAWHVQPFAFDWRKDINVSSDALASFVESNFKNKPVHIVAHSMGGLVARNFIRRHTDVWEKMRGDDNQGGRLIMLGTPNYGSFAMLQVMTGVETLVRWLAKLDLMNSLTQVVEVINSFVSSYQMLPAPQKIPPAVQSIYRTDTWGSFPVSAMHLGRAKEFHEHLGDQATVDPERMTYIAGCNRRTLSAVEIIRPGEFRYFETLEGDGRVPHALGLLDRVRTYYVDEAHGDLPKNDRVITAIDEVLDGGSTSLLAEHPLAPRAAVIKGGRWHRSIAEHGIGVHLERLAKRAAANELSPDEQRAAEETLLSACLGEDQPAGRLAEVTEGRRTLHTADPAFPRPQLHVEVVRGDVADVSAPVVVVGQYTGVAPINAVGALDSRLDYWISQAVKRSMIGSDLGQLFFIPVQRKQIAADTVLLAGMGEEGKFNLYDLRYLMLNVTYAVSTLKVNKFATVLIGSGAGNLKEDRAIRGMLFGICDALYRLPDDQSPAEGRLKHVILIEKDVARYRRIFETLAIIKTEDSAVNVDIRVTHRELPQAAEGENELATSLRPADLPDASFGPRITIERDGDLFRFSALTHSAVIPVREVEIQSFFPEGIAERLMNSTTTTEQQTFGQLLTTTLIPEDFQEVFDSAEPLTLILDRSTASLPWEMACFTRPEGTAFFGTHLNLTRQFRTPLSAKPGIAPQLNNSLRVLIIADPAPELEYQLPGARLEGRAVATALNRIKREQQLDIDVVDRIGDAECDPVEILGLILEGHFDVVHYAGHAVFNERNPSHGGWVFGENRVLSAREIFRARRVPRLVFANACFSAVVNRGKQITAEMVNLHLAGMAEAFFVRGVQNYIGAGWPVDDDLAATFARTFYANALTGRSLEGEQVGRNCGMDDNRGDGSGTKPDQSSTAANRHIEPRTLSESLAEARKLILHTGSTWGAYQHYGQAADLLMPKSNHHKSDRTFNTAPQQHHARPKASTKANRKNHHSTSRKKR